jgi:hypothetical protein
VILVTVDIEPPWVGVLGHEKPPFMGQDRFIHRMETPIGWRRVPGVAGRGMP